ncbi:MAG: hypothetical protein LHV68_07470 [Elusimicrobia bacterium]|nr:hypothetical protein [Candidatus Liberimonas magnetica]
MNLNPGRYIVDKEFQYSYIFRSLLLLFFVMFSTFAIIIVWNNFKFYQGYLLNPPSGEQVTAWAKANNVPTDSIEAAFQYYVQAKPYRFYEIIIVPVLIIFAVNAVVIAIASLYISYKIAVPLHELKIALRKKVETGNFEKQLTVRKGDPFHELTSIANLAFFVAVHPALKPFAKTDETGSGT